jgi:hypothetical protein
MSGLAHDPILSRSALWSKHVLPTAGACTATWVAGRLPKKLLFPSISGVSLLLVTLRKKLTINQVPVF